MFLPVGAAFRALTRTVEFRTIPRGAILARARKARALVATPIVARLVVTGLVKTRLVEIARAVAGRTRIALAPVLALLPRLGIATLRPIAEILARTPVRRAAR